MGARRRAPLAAAGLVTLAAVGGLVAWALGVAAPNEPAPIADQTTPDPGGSSDPSDPELEATSVVDAGLVSIDDGADHGDVERVRTELMSARALLETRERMVDRGAAIREELERNAEIGRAHV